MALVPRTPYDPHNGADYATEIEITDIVVRAECLYCNSHNTVRLDPRTFHGTTSCFKCDSLFNIEITGMRTPKEVLANVDTSR